MNKSIFITNQSTTTAMNIATAMCRRNAAAEAYWKSVMLCIARTDGSAEIHYRDGRVGASAQKGTYIAFVARRAITKRVLSRIVPLP